jgi:hypothetical protein
VVAIARLRRSIASNQYPVASNQQGTRTWLR